MKRPLAMLLVVSMTLPLGAMAEDAITVEAAQMAVEEVAEPAMEEATEPVAEALEEIVDQDAEEPDDEAVEEPDDEAAETGEQDDEESGEPEEEEDPVIRTEAFEEVVEETEALELPEEALDLEEPGQVDFIETTEAYSGVVMDENGVIRLEDIRDEGVRRALSEESRDGETLTSSDREYLYDLTIYDASDLSVLQYLPELDSLTLYNFQGEVLDTVGIPNLTYLHVKDAAGDELKLQLGSVKQLSLGNPSTQNAYSVFPTRLEFSDAASLEQLQLDRLQAPTRMDLSAATGLKTLTINNVSDLDALDLSTAQTVSGLRLFIDRSLLASFDLSRLGNLTSLYISGCAGMLPDLTRAPKLKAVTLDSFNGTELDMSRLAHLETLTLMGYSGRTLDFSQFANLKNLYLYWSPNLRSLDLSHSPKLEYLQISGLKELASINLGKASHLNNLSLTGMPKINALDLSSAINLDHIMLDSMSGIKKLDLSACVNLRGAYCENNQISTLILGSKPKLIELNCESNKLTTLDISGCTALLPYINDSYHSVEEDFNIDIVTKKTTYYEYSVYSFIDDSRDAYYMLTVDPSVELITQKVVAPTATPVPTPAPTEAPAAAPATPAMSTITAVKKSSKTTVIAAPGAVYQLDLGGATGKKFKSSNKKIATVSSDGVVTVKKAGKTKISVKVGKKTRTVTLVIKDPTIPTAIALNLSGTVAARKGETQTLNVTLPEGTASGIKWKSSNKKVATVKNGVVTFKKAGKVTITATATRGKKKAKVKFVVSK